MYTWSKQMKLIPALALMLAVFSCDSDPPAPVAQPEPVEEPVAAPSTPVPTTPVEEPEPEIDPNLQFHTPFLYKITKENNFRVSWVFGTVNAPLQIDFARVPDSLRTALESSSHIMFEVPTGSAAQRDRTRRMAMNEGSARRELGTKRFSRLQEITKTERAVLDVMHPWVLYLTLEEKLDGKPSMAEQLEAVAGSYRKRMLYLETVPQQVSLLEEQINFENLGTMIDEFEDHEKVADSVLEAYKVGNEAGIIAAVFPSEDSRGAVYQKLSEARVPVWAARMSAQFDNEQTLAVVNVRYTIGPNNLVEELTKLGWTVERVK